MKLKFFLEHENSKLFQVFILQAVVIIGVFGLFFYSLGFAEYYAITVGVIIFLAIATLYHFLNLPFFILPLIKGAVFVPTKAEDISAMVELSAIKKGEKMVDLGSGDGRVVAAFAKAGAHATGLELNPDMIVKAEALLAEENVPHAKILWQSFWDVDLSEFDVVTVYGYPTLMKKLAQKLDKELTPGTRVLSNQFPFTDWDPTKQVGKVYLYVIK